MIILAKIRIPLMRYLLGRLRVNLYVNLVRKCAKAMTHFGISLFLLRKLTVLSYSSSMFGCELVDCLKQHFREETINDVWTCDKCKRKNKSVKRKIQIS